MSSPASARKRRAPPRLRTWAALLVLPALVAATGPQPVHDAARDATGPLPGGSARNGPAPTSRAATAAPVAGRCPPKPAPAPPPSGGVLADLLNPLTSLLSPAPPKPAPPEPVPGCPPPAPSGPPGSPPPPQDANSPMPPPSYAPPQPPAGVPQLLGPVTALVLPPTEPTDPRPGPGRVWTLTASDLTLHGVRYHGYDVQDVAGRPTTTLRFTVDRLEITDLVQRGWLANGRNVKAAAAPKSVSTIDHGPIELHVLQLTGTLSALGFPLVPLTLSPNTLLLPNLDLSFLKLPVLSFRNVTVRNVDLRGGNLRIPEARITQENEGHYERSQSLTQGPRASGGLLGRAGAPPDSQPPAVPAN